MDKAMDIKVDNALTAKEAKELSNSAVAAYAEQWLPEILAEIFAQIRLAAKNEQKYAYVKAFGDYRNHIYLYDCIEEILVEMGYVVSVDTEIQAINISWF